MSNLHIIVWKSNDSCLAIDLAFDSFHLAEIWLGDRSKINRDNVLIKPLAVVNSTVMGFPDVPDSKE